LDAALQERVCIALKGGLDIEQACALNMINRATFYEWRKRGRGGEEPYAAFLAATEEAMLRVDLALHGTVLREALGDKERNRSPNPRMALEYLKYRKTGGRQQVELTGPDGTPIPILGALTNDAADMIRRRILYGERPPEIEGEPEPTEEPR
jgi:hypothetical protein